MSVDLMNGGSGGDGSSAGGEGSGSSSGSFDGGSNNTGAGAAAGGDAGSAGAGDAGGEGGEAVEFTPNPKFKYPDPTSLDKHVQLEGEVDPFFQSLIKDADSEKKVKELYEKAYGLDSIKPRYQKQATELREARQQLNTVNDTIAELGSAYQRNDFDGFFKILNVPEEKILQWMVDKINYSKLPEDQRQTIDARRQAEIEALTVSKQFQSLESQHRESLVQHRQLSLQVAIQDPSVADYAKSFDARAGKPGAFRQAVCERGEFAWLRSQGKVDLTPEQAIQEVMAQYGAMNSAAQPAAPGANGQPASPAQKPAVIPNVDGRGGASPMTKPRPKSIEDLKKLAASM